MYEPSTASPKRAAHGAIELGGRGRGAEQIGRDRVLHRDGEAGERDPESDARDHDAGYRLSERRIGGHPGDEHDANSHNGDAGEALHAVVPAQTREGLARQPGGHHHAQHHGREERAAAGRRGSEHALEEQRNEDDGAEHAESGKEDGDQRHAHGAVGVDAQRHDGVACPAFHRHEDQDHDGGKGEDADDLGREPLVLTAAQRQANEQRHDDQREQGHARVVQAMDPARGTDVGEEANEQGDYRQAQGQVDVEDPVPRQAVGDEAAQGGADDRREAEDPGHDSLVLAALGGREQVAYGGQGHGHDAAAADALDGAKGDELVHRLAEAGQYRSNQEDADAAQEKRLASIEVRESPSDGHHRGGCDQIGRGDPGEPVEPAQVGHDARHGRADDRLIERCQKHARA